MQIIVPTKGNDNRKLMLMKEVTLETRDATAKEQKELIRF